MDIVVATGNGTVDSLLNHQATENPHRVSFVYTKEHNDIMVLVAEADNNEVILVYMKVHENTCLAIATSVTVLLDPGGAAS